MHDDGIQELLAELSAKALAEYRRLLVALDLVDVDPTRTDASLNARSTTGP